MNAFRASVVPANLADIFYFVIFFTILIVSWIVMVIDRAVRVKISDFARLKKWIT